MKAAVFLCSVGTLLALAVARAQEPTRVPSNLAAAAVKAQASFDRGDYREAAKGNKLRAGVEFDEAARLDPSLRKNAVLPPGDYPGRN